MIGNEVSGIINLPIVALSGSFMPVDAYILAKYQADTLTEALRKSAADWELKTSEAYFTISSEPHSLLILVCLLLLLNIADTYLLNTMTEG